MSASLVGSEMCIRDRFVGACVCARSALAVAFPIARDVAIALALAAAVTCLLYTSDAADDM
eukprot:5138829-Alexandrium_andersonii.AAC.1